MMMRVLAIIGAGAGCLLLAADDSAQKVQVSNTERIEFPPSGTLRLTNSIGAVTVEAWDRPEVEITTIKSTKPGYDARNRDRAARELDAVHVKTERRGNELVVTTDYPGRQTAYLTGQAGFSLEYHIKAPSAVRLVVNHNIGEVNVDGLTGDIEVTLHQGEVMLHLPADGKYDIKAKCAIGNVNSDFPGQEKRRGWLFGHRTINGTSTAAHKLNLKVGDGDIVIVRTRIPKPPGPLIPAQKTDGL